MRIPRWLSPGSRLRAACGRADRRPRPPLRLSAQAPEQRAELERFRDSLGRDLGFGRAPGRSSGGLIDLAKADRSNALVHLRLGFLSLRLGELGGQAHYDDAASEFQWAIDLQPTWPYAWYGMGLAEYGVGDSQISFVTGLKTMLGKDALTRSAMAFAKSAEVDPSFVRGPGGALQYRAPAAGEHQARRGARRPAARGSTSAGHDPQVLLARGRVEREVGDGDSALAAFHGYLRAWRRAGAWASSRSRARCSCSGRFDGVQPVLRGRGVRRLRRRSPATAADLATIASDSVLKEFDHASGAQRVPPICKQFWTERDRTELRGDGERLREHYRRLFYARKNFQLTSLNRHYDIVERYRSGSRDFDDRGVIYIRHGEPTSRATYAAPGLEPNESWRYSRPDGDLIFHFVAREDVQDFKLVESLFDVLGFSQAIALRGGSARPTTRSPSS